MSVIAGAMREMSDGDLVAVATLGRHDVFEELVRRYQRPIASYVFRMLGDYDLALDVTQDVFLKVYNSLDKYSSEYKFSTWLYRIAHNAAIDHMRKNSANLRSLTSDPDAESQPFEIESRELSPEQNRERTEWLSEIDGVIRLLPEPYRELILLRHARDMSYDEIAEITGLPLGTVKNRLFRARDLMKQLFVERGLTSYTGR